MVTPRASGGKAFSILLLSFLSLAVTATLSYFAVKYKKKSGEMVRKENARIQASFLLEHARDILERADRISRLPGADPDDIQGLCEEATESATKAAALRPDMEEPFRLRGRAREMQHRYAEAEADYGQAIRNLRTSHGYLRRGLLGLRRHSRKLLLETAAKADERSSEDLRYAIYHSTGDVSDERNCFLASAGVGFLLGDYPSVPGMCDTAATFDPTEWFNPFIKGLAFLALQEPDRAMEAFDAALRISPYVAEAHAFRAMILRRMGRSPDAIDAFNLALQKDEQFLEAAYLRGRAHFDSRHFEEARADFLRATSAVPDARLRGAVAGLEAWRRASRKDADFLREMVGELDACLPDSRQARARALLELGEAEKALADANAVLAKEPNLEEMLVLRARIHVLRKDWPAADVDLTKVGNLRERARVRALAGRVDDALSDLDLLLLKDSKDVSVHLERARIQLEAARVDDALATIEALRGFAPGHARAELLTAEAMLAKKDPQAAIRWATEAYESDSQLAEALVVRGRAHLALGAKEAADADFKKALEINPALKARIPD